MRHVINSNSHSTNHRPAGQPANLAQLRVPQPCKQGKGELENGPDASDAGLAALFPLKVAGDVASRAAVSKARRSPLAR